MEDREEPPAAGEPERPPGHFMEEQFAHDTARFLAEVKRIAERRRLEGEQRSWDVPHE